MISSKIMVAIHQLFSYLLLLKVNDVNGSIFFTSNLKKNIIGLRASSSSSSSSSSSTTTHRNLQTSGYCSYDPTIQCLSVADCDGCIGRRLLRDNLLYHRHLAKPECGDGTCRKKCRDCASTDPECDPDNPQSCVAPTSSPTTSPQVSYYNIYKVSLVIYILYFAQSVSHTHILCTTCVADAIAK